MMKVVVRCSLFFALWRVSTSVTLANNVFSYNEVSFDSHPPNPPNDITVAAYYYPWHYRHFQVVPDGYIRRELEPRQEIRLGEYDDREPAIIQQHLEWSQQANIKVWVTSWWGPNSSEDQTLIDVILNPSKVNLGDHKIAILYETTGRIKKNEGYNHTKRVPSDFDYICNDMKYFDHNNYYKINNRPVIVIYLTRLLDGKEILDDVVPIIREKCPNVYIIGDQIWGSPPGKTLDYLDAVTNYDIYGNMKKPRFARQSGVDEYYRKATAWKGYASQHNTHFVPSVSPGYNDRGVRLQDNNTALSRRLDEGSKEGSLFAAQLVQAMTLLDPGADNLLLVNSFNEWHEDTQIEPCDGITASLPSILTQDLEYVGYGTLYLDILATYTLKNAVAAPKSELAIKFTGLPYSKTNLAAYYWSWFTEENFEDSLRAHLSPPQTCTFSEAADPIPADLWLSWQANIRIWITPWEKPCHATDIGAATLFNNAYLASSTHQLALQYNVKSRFADGGVTNVKDDILYLCQKYFQDNSYYRTSSGKPVLFIGLTRIYSDQDLGSIVDSIRFATASSGCNTDLFLVGDEIWGDAKQAPYYPFSKLDAVTNHDVFGNMGAAGYAGQSKLDDYYEKQRQWRIAAWQEGCSYVPTVIPGFNDRATRGDRNQALSRVLTETGVEGSLFAVSLDKARHLVDSQLDDLILINSLNHFVEDTQIYPICGREAVLPSSLTQNMTYSAYETTYLDLLTERFGSYEDSGKQLPSPYQCPVNSTSNEPSSQPSHAPSWLPSLVPSYNPSLSVLPTTETPSLSTIPPASRAQQVLSGCPLAVPSNSPMVIFDENFENGWDIFVSGGDNSKLKSKVKYDGRHSLQVRHNGGTSLADTKKPYDVSTYYQVKVTFQYLTKNVDVGEKFVLRYSSDDGSSWRTAKAFIKGTTWADDGSWNEASVTLDVDDMNSIMLRFKTHFDRQWGAVFIDAVFVEGYLQTTLGPSSSPTRAPVPPTLVPSSAPTTSRVIIFKENFEMGWDVFQSGGTKSALSRKVKYNGQYSLQVRHDDGSSLANTKTSYNVLNYDQVKVNFQYFTKNVDVGEKFVLRYSVDDGSLWRTAKAFIRGTDWDSNGSWNEASVTLDVTDMSWMKLRFQSRFSAAWKQVFIDAVSFEGCPEGKTCFE